MKQIILLITIVTCYVLEANPIADEALENYINTHGDLPPDNERSFIEKYFWVFILGYFMIQKYFPSKKSNDD